MKCFNSLATGSSCVMHLPEAAKARLETRQRTVTRPRKASRASSSFDDTLRVEMCGEGLTRDGCSLWWLR